MEQNYKYNGGTEFNTDLSLNMYETLFRGYDPAIGRFHQIDPVTDFLPGINPYQFGFNNPISMIDPDGLKPIRPLEFLRRLFRGFFGDAASKQARRSQRQANAQGATRPPRGKGKRPKGGSGGQNNDNANDQMSSINIPEIAKPDMGFIGFDLPLNETIDIPKRPITSDPPKFRDKPIPSGTSISFGENISFISKTDQLKNKYSAELKLKDLIGILQSNPALRLHIVGNATIKKSSSLIEGNSEDALNQEGFILNGFRTTGRNLMNSKAEAVRRFLLENGIDGSRITIGPGNIIRLNTDEDLGIGGKVGFTIKN